VRFLVLGAAGLQARAAIWDLLRQEGVEEVIAADADGQGLAELIRQIGSDRLQTVVIDAADPDAIARLMRDVIVTIDLLPSRIMPEVCLAAIAARCHVVNTNYREALPMHVADDALRAGITILPEAGLDPGIDLVLCAHGAGQLDRVTELHSWCGGIPEPAAAAGSPIAYKISWSWEGVLKSYARPAVMLRDGETVRVAAVDQHHAKWIEHIDFPGVGRLESIPNGDAVHFVEMLGLGGQVRDSSRRTFRWPGHSEFWKALTDLGFLSEEPVGGLDLARGGGVSPREFMLRHLEPRLQYGPEERDLVVMRVIAGGERGGSRVRLTYDLVDRRDLATGFMGMNRTVGFAASIAAMMVATGEIYTRGLLSAVRDIPQQRFLEQLAARGVVISERVEPLGRDGLDG